MGELVCTEFDEFEEALYGVQGRYVLRSRQQRDWRLRVMDLNGVALMHGCEGAGTVYSGVGLSGFFNVFLPLSSHEFTVVDGRRFDRQRVGWMVPEAMFHIDASRPATWLTVAISCERVLQWAQEHEDEFDLSILARNVVNVAQMDLAHLIWLAQRLFAQEEREPEVLHTPAAEHAARTELLRVVFATVLPAVEPRRVQRHCLDHKRVLDTALDMLASLDDTPVYLSDLCRVTGASERTIRNLFNRYLGMSPHRYLMVHRLHSIRTALRCARPGETVTSLCARYGVWDFGRFARHYRGYFGELPSQTLRMHGAAGRAAVNV